MPNQTGPKRTPREREVDIPVEIRLWVRGLSLKEIAAEISKDRPYSVGYSTIDRDIKIERAAWRSETLGAIDELIACELIRVNQIEREAWDAWERSKKDSERSVTERKTGESETMRAQMVREGQCGDPRYLTQVQWCIDKRCKLLGLDAPQRSQIEVTMPYQAISDEQLDQMIKALADGADA